MWHSTAFEMYFLHILICFTWIWISYYVPWRLFPDQPIDPYHPSEAIGPTLHIPSIITHTEFIQYIFLLEPNIWEHQRIIQIDIDILIKGLTLLLPSWYSCPDLSCLKICLFWLPTRLKYSTLSFQSVENFPSIQHLRPDKHSIGFCKFFFKGGYELFQSWFVLWYRCSFRKFSFRKINLIWSRKIAKFYCCFGCHDENPTLVVQMTPKWTVQR